MELAKPYEPLTLMRLGRLLTGADDSRRWRFVAEFLEEYRWEPPATRGALLSTEPATSGDERWDTFLAALAEHLAAEDGHAAPDWADSRALRQFWFPFNTRAARVDAIVNAPAPFRRRGVFVAAQELNGGSTNKPARTSLAARTRTHPESSTIQDCESRQPHSKVVEARPEHNGRSS